MTTPLSTIVVLAAVLTVAFLVSAKSRARARFSYRESSAQTTIEMRPDGSYMVHESTGVVRNHSTEANSLESLHLVCWWPNRGGTALFTGNPVMITDANADAVLPLRFEEKSNHALVLRWEVRIDVSPDTARRRRYEVALQDSDRRLFDQHGQLKNRRNIERLRRFTDSMRGENDGIPTLATTTMKLKMHDTVFVAQWLLWRIGF